MIIKGINLLIGKINGLIGDGLFSKGLEYIGVPNGKIPTIPEAKIPRLAQGAVIPPNREFMAVLGDQRNGRNLEAPEDLIRKIVREESGRNQQSGGTYQFTAMINRRVLFDEMMTEAQLRMMANGKNPYTALG